MTVSSSTAKSGPYTGNGSTKVFAYGFRILDATHLRVTRQLTDGTIQDVSASEYAVSGVGGTSGSVTFTIAPSSGQKITIIREVPRTQAVDLVNQGTYYAETVEEALDKLVMIDQEQDEEISRAIRAPAGDTAGDMTLPAASERAGKVMEFDGTGKPTAGSFSTSGLSSLADQIRADQLAATAAATTAAAEADEAAASAATAATQATAAAQSLASITDVVLTAQPTVSKFTGDGTTTSFPLTVQNAPLESSFVFVNGVYKRKTADYSISGYSLNFVVAPTADHLIEVVTGGFTTIATTTIGGVTGLQAALDAKLDLAGGTLSGNLRIPAGAVGLPSLAVGSDTTTGIWFPGAGRIAFSGAGTEGMRLDAGQLLIGHNALVTGPAGQGRLQLAGGASAVGILSGRWATDALGATIQLLKARNGTPGGHGAVLNNDVMGRILAGGSDGTNWLSGGELLFEVDGASGVNDLPTRLVVKLAPDGSATPAEVFRLAQDGRLTIGGVAQVGSLQVGSTAGNTVAMSGTTLQLTSVAGTIVLRPNNASASDLTIAAGGHVRSGTSGDATAPAFSFSAATGAGMFRDANGVGIASGGTECMRATGTAFVAGRTDVFAAFTSANATGLQHTVSNGQTLMSANGAVPLQVKRYSDAGTVAMIQFYSGVSAAGGFQSTGGGTPSTYAGSSDFRLKTNIRDVENPGAIIDALRPRRFTRHDGVEDIGFVAQELREVLPAQVFPIPAEALAGLPPLPEGEEPYLTVSPTSHEMVLVMLAELKSLRARVAELEAR